MRAVPTVALCVQPPHFKIAPFAMTKRQGVRWDATFASPVTSTVRKMGEITQRHLMNFYQMITILTVICCTHGLHTRYSHDTIEGRWRTESKETWRHLVISTGINWLKLHVPLQINASLAHCVVDPSGRSAFGPCRIIFIKRPMCEHSHLRPRGNELPRLYTVTDITFSQADVFGMRIGRWCATSFVLRVVIGQ